MLLYNHKQEFIGINEEGLRILNYSSLNELLGVCSDVADLFANEPGYIHNFKNFGWIDFLLHADSDASSAIVHAKGRVFSCKLTVSSFYLCESPTQSSYSIEMSHIQTLSGEDIKPHTITPKPIAKEFVAPVIKAEPQPSILPDYTDIQPTKLSEPTVLDVPPLEINLFDDTDTSSSAPINEKPFLDDLADSPFKTFTEETPAPAPKKPQDRPMLGSDRYNSKEKECLDRHNVPKNYLYDPHVAANELGLPVDLIEEFIGDFIQQSHDFKESLFESNAKSDFNNLHILSHKLKGVAANLRIEDAFETLSVINTSTDSLEVEANLKYYFDIIRKLSGETVNYDEASTEAEPSSTKDSKDTDDIYDFGLKVHDDSSTLMVQEEEIFSEETIEKPLFSEESFIKDRLNIEEAVVKDSPVSDDVAEYVETTFLDDIAPVKSVEEEPFIAPQMPKIHYDKALIADSLGIDLAFMDELLFDYKNDSRLISNQITEAIKAFDTHSWNTSAAKLKGISDNLRLNEISDELIILANTHDAQEAKQASLRLNAYLDQL